MGDDGNQLSERARGHIPALILANGGASEAEATLLLKALARLSEIQREQGPQAAEAAALALKMAWSGEEDR
ncbi:hypothetical protein [Phenylobacterium sp. J367]|uniref:hypothetical protein n=1 Tax=Phenylobacterium sp. J367 TaxID=2898435 RepID=UPI002151CCC6|nr:hypothetical protein [Phenylobacterium sp. J367]MCR5879227.1 hypothetical protein [Phenylobacterium sp. J367]